MIMISFEYVYKFPEFHYFQKLYWNFRHSCLFPKLQMLSQQIATNSDSVTMMMWSCQQQLCALHFKTIWLQKTCFSVKITRIILEGKEGFRSIFLDMRGLGSPLDSNLKAKILDIIKKVELSSSIPSSGDKK